MRFVSTFTFRSSLVCFTKSYQASSCAKSVGKKRFTKELRKFASFLPLVKLPRRRTSALQQTNERRKTKKLLEKHSNFAYSLRVCVSFKSRAKVKSEMLKAFGKQTTIHFCKLNKAKSDESLLGKVSARVALKDDFCGFLLCD